MSEQSLEPSVADSAHAAGHLNGADVAPNHGLPNLPLKAGQTIRFTPACAQSRDPLPVYLLKIPGVAEAAAFRRAVTVACGMWPSDDVILLALKAAATLHLPDGDVEFVAAMIEQGGPKSLDAAAALKLVEAQLLPVDETYRGLIATRNYLQTMMPFMAIQHYLVGWENVDAVFARKNGLTSADCVSQIPFDERLELGSHALQLTGATEQLAKN